MERGLQSRAVGREEHMSWLCTSRRFISTSSSLVLWTGCILDSIFIEFHPKEFIPFTTTLQQEPQYGQWTFQKRWYRCTFRETFTPHLPFLCFLYPMRNHIFFSNYCIRELTNHDLPHTGVKSLTALANWGNVMRQFAT